MWSSYPSIAFLQYIYDSQLNSKTNDEKSTASILYGSITVNL